MHISPGAALYVFGFRINYLVGSCYLWNNRKTKANYADRQKEIGILEPKWVFRVVLVNALDGLGLREIDKNVGILLIRTMY